MTNTANYDLPQWEASDRVKRSDFNAAMQSIDTALAALPKIVFGSYEGDGVANRVIPLEFAPKIMILMAHIMNSGAIFVLTPVTTAYMSDGGVATEPVAGGGYSPYLNGASLHFRTTEWGNKAERTVYYILIG